ncbi:MAG TPA: beta-ketoacyl-[acyl-carrier-protein] synthase family protein [Tepidisphaeraceae bacterium]
MTDVVEIEPVVITGVGMAAPLGLCADAVFDRVCAADCGIGPLSAIESALPPGADGGQAPDLPADYLPGQPREVRYLRHAIEQAVADAGWDAIDSAPARRAVLLGTTLHGMRAGGEFLRSGDYAALKNLLAADTLALAIEGLAIEGPRLTTCSACSSSLDAIALGVTLLQAGDVDVVIAGGYDTMSEYVWAGFNALRLVSGPPLRPFVRGRQGMKVSEGYAVVVLERRADAVRRGASMLAAVSGWGDSADAFHLTRPDPSGDGAARSMRAALSRAGVGAGEIGLIAAHATGTPDNDTAEAAAIGAVLGDSAAGVPVVGFKSHLGHTLGGAGAVELILSAKALAANRLPGCANVNAVDVEYPHLNVRTGPAVVSQIEATLNTSLGFGGANASAVLQHPHRPVTRGRKSREVCVTGVGVIAPGIIGHDAWVAAGGRLHEGHTAIDDAALAALLDARRIRRLSPYVKHTLAATALATRHAKLDESSDLLRSASAFLATTHGSVGYCHAYYGQIVRDGVAAANPMLFAEGVPNAAAAHVSLTFGLRGGCRTFIGSTNAGLDALHLAALRVAAGDTPLAVVGAAEESGDVIDAAYRGCDPAAPAAVSAAVALIIEPLEAARARGAIPLAQITTASPSASVTVGAHPRGAYSVGPLLSLATAVLQAAGPIRVTAVDRTGASSAAHVRP